MSVIVPVILSGGSGTRLWPLSRSMRPKQFIELIGEQSLFKRTVDRLDGLADVTDPIVVCNEEHRFMVAEQLQELNRAHHAIMLEPAGRNTAPAIAAAAFKLIDTHPDALMLVLPADHVIDDQAALHRAILSGAPNAANGQLVAFGVKADRPSTGYGYLKTASGNTKDAPRKVDKFVEKPDIKQAEAFVSEGGYYWNSGMFLFSPQAYLDALDAAAPEIHQHVKQSLDQAVNDLDFIRLESQSYENCPNISVDYAIMENADNLFMVPLDAGWNDIGSWSSLWETGDKDARGNVTKGDVWLDSVSNSYIHAENKMVSAVGVENLVIVETHDGVMISAKHRDQEVKQVVDRLKQAGRPEAALHRKAFRPWGNYDCLDSGERFQVKRIMVKPGQCTSMQKHAHRAEHWIVVSGEAEVVIGDETRRVKGNESAYIPLGEKHRLSNPGDVPLELIEVQSGSYLGEDDIVRLDDEYGRS